jgi:hypothetical protein
MQPEPKRTAVQKMKANDMAHSFLRMQKTGAKMFLIGEVVHLKEETSNSLFEEMARWENNLKS